MGRRNAGNALLIACIKTGLRPLGKACAMAYIRLDTRLAAGEHGMLNILCL
jgi:hypothetical protein